MAANKKLTKIIAGRKITSVNQTANALDITFDDNSQAHIKTGANASANAMSGRTIRSVRQQGDVMNLDFSDGSSAEITLAEATSSVILRDASNKLEYAD
jgi:hypothetical protein